jgi:hypothetical protein
LEDAESGFSHGSMDKANVDWGEIDRTEVLCNYFQLKFTFQVPVIMVFIILLVSVFWIYWTERTEIRSACSLGVFLQSVLVFYGWEEDFEIQSTLVISTTLGDKKSVLIFGNKFEDFLIQSTLDFIRMKGPKNFRIKSRGILKVYLLLEQKKLSDKIESRL